MDLEQLKLDLSNWDETIRRNAVKTLGDSEMTSILPLFESAINDADANVRLQVVRALMNIGGEKVLPLLGKMLDDKNVKICREVIRALQYIGGIKAIALLEIVANHPMQHIRYEARSAINRLHHSLPLERKL
ncbi:MAG: HEAT repeat domain-containing protein [Planctomycetota bacterium]